MSYPCVVCTKEVRTRHRAIQCDSCYRWQHLGCETDFEQAAWRAISTVFPSADIKGCAFHWGQAVMRKVATLGLRTTYLKRSSTCHFIRKMLSIPYLPVDHIQAAFQSLTMAANTVPLQQLCTYIRSNWIESTLWGPSQWCVFRQLVRTNNDTEGWHRRFISRAGGNQLQFYKLVPALKAEGDTVSIQMRLVEENNLTKCQRPTYFRIQRRLNNLWNDYEERKNQDIRFPEIMW